MLNPGTCSHCGKTAPRRILIAVWEGNSGPGWEKYGCLPCARALAASPCAPTWLRLRVSSLDHECDHDGDTD